MLVDVQITVHNILLGKKYCDDAAVLTELKPEVQRPNSDIASIKHSLQQTTNHCQKELDAAKQVIRRRNL